MILSTSAFLPINEPLIDNGRYDNQIDSNKSLSIAQPARPKVKGKFIYLGKQKFFIKGVSYGAFRPDQDGNEYQDSKKIDDDFSMMAKYGFNTVRIPHTTPPRSVLDIAQKYGLKVMVSLSAEQYVGYLIDKAKTHDLKGEILKKVREFKNHPALLCVSIGNEIPASIVRWLGARKVEKYLKKVYHIVKKEDPGLIVTYVNYPTTEYLQLPFLDLLCFNVYLENQETFENYLYRLHNLAGNRPLIMGEIGLDSLRNGTDKQALTLEWQIHSVFRTGCSGLFIFSWTDEWHRGEEDVYDWKFGLTTIEREPKPALNTVNAALAKGSHCFEAPLPRISVVVCTYNGGKTIRKCLQSLKKIKYPDFEVLLINDGSTDNTLEIASEFDFKIITTPNLGLSHARNLGMEQSSGEIIAYLDDDAFPDPDWLTYLAIEFESGQFAAVGGPNISPEDVGLISHCVNHAPGSPTHVLHTDRIAEHIPGCNMAFRKEKLQAIGGFDQQFRVAGDDVDVCWRLQENGGIIGFSPSAQVWHLRRSTIKGYWKQQYGYGKSEALLEKKWPRKYTHFGHRTWGGRLYGDGTLYLSSLSISRIYSGIWGTAPFQSIYEVGKRNFLAYTLMPEWYLFCFMFTLLSTFGIVLKPLSMLIPFTIAFISLPLNVIIHTVYNLEVPGTKKKRWVDRAKFRIITTFLYLIQPLARLWGRLNHKLTPWRMHNKSFFSPMIFGVKKVWCEKWVAPELRLENFESEIKLINSYISRGGDFDRWDFKLSGGAFGGINILMASEDHAKGTQYLRFRISATLSSIAKYSLFFTLILLSLAIIDHSWTATAIFSGVLILLLIRIFWDCSIASGCCIHAVEKQKS